MIDITLFDEGMPPPQCIASDVEKTGFAIYPNAIKKEVIHELREFWLGFVCGNNPTKCFLRGSLFLGEQDGFTG